MATTAAERKAKQRREMLEKGLVRKDLWLSKESLEVIENFKSVNELKSNDEAINQILEQFKQALN
ncbi:hypothetical protein [Acinetobacter baumannii]|uniref:hypothetical protein n=1 Tax=Acinetobacter baumannii TaxID=470 RepID=UPI000E093216|nr:hypothetical protein [Acinetobacter baumannii]RDF39047.1 hypothetical protein DWA23_07835 [Acinetobacter baumannii]RDF57714.1 hypothetical protein DWA13_12315 [Acinetobacter baumannii]TDI19730.1 hypothetical protein DWA09_08495 [Acinetobacter baumannii]